MRFNLPSAAPLGWGAWYGVWSHWSSRGAFEAMISSPHVGYHARVMGALQRAALALLYFKVAFSFSFFSCGKSFLLVFRSFSERVSLYVCYFGVCLEGGKPRIFLLCHLVPTPEFPSSVKVSKLKFHINYPYGISIFFNFFLLYWNIVNNVVLVSGVQQSDPVMHIHACIFQILSPEFPGLYTRPLLLLLTSSR